MLSLGVFRRMCVVFPSGCLWLVCFGWSWVSEVDSGECFHVLFLSDYLSGWWFFWGSMVRRSLPKGCGGMYQTLLFHLVRGMLFVLDITCSLVAISILGRFGIQVFLDLPCHCFLLESFDVVWDEFPSQKLCAKTYSFSIVIILLVVFCFCRVLWCLSRWIFHC